MKFAKTLTVLCGMAASLSPAMAEGTHAKNWQMGLIDSASPVSDYIHWFHNGLLLPIITVISLFVLALLIYVMVKFNSRANPVPTKTTHNTFIEVVWTVVPILILVVIAIPSFRLLYLQRDIPKPDMTIKIIGNPSWNWTYEYPDLGVDETGAAKVSFTAYLKPEADAAKDGSPYLLATDVPVVVPVNKIVKTIVTSDPEGIIHAWTIPAFGMKIDAIPGRLNEDWFQAAREGIFYGQCSELCGKDHAFMPIAIRVVTKDEFAKWLDAFKAGTIDDANATLPAIS